MDEQSRIRIPFTRRYRTLLEISPDQTMRFLALCCEHKATLTAFLHTLLVEVLSRLVTAREGGANYKYLATRAPVSLRRFTDGQVFALCDHVSAANYLPRIAPLARGAPFPWKAARKFGDGLRAGVARRWVCLACSSVSERRTAPSQGSWARSTKTASFSPILGDFLRTTLRRKKTLGSGRSRRSSLRIATTSFVWGKSALDEDIAEACAEEMKAAFDHVLQVPWHRSQNLG
ncbi:hypothetical protein PsYK624_042240 [Phanerochaete sordida]|uniref:Uncharacterized protein n=1 Tax=Phanerochaete sordida TaxID=48140 RepID=A0A9P3G4K4_9APHY|nr:hypothetical protein PsYK624_042240 [Phanerochaete sordida]